MHKQYMHFTFLCIAQNDILKLSLSSSWHSINQNPLLIIHHSAFSPKASTRNNLFQLKYSLYRIKNRLGISFKSAISLSINVLNPCYWPSTVQAVITHCPTYHLFPVLVCSRKTDSCNSISLFNLRTIWL